MSDTNDLRLATLPESIYSRPDMLDQSGLNVTVFGEDGRDFGAFSFEEISAPEQVVKSLVLGFVKATGSEGRWRSKSSVKLAAATVRNFAKAIAESNPSLSNISDLSPEMWWAWRTEVQKRARWPGQINMARALLYDVDGLQETTIKALKQRTRKPKSREYAAYSEPEFRRIRSAAWRIVRKAKSRIKANVEYLERFILGLELKDAEYHLPIHKKLWTKGMLLDHIDKTGMFPNSKVPNYYFKEFQALLGVTEEGPISQALFATTFEIYSLFILFVCERGYNSSVLSEMKVNALRADALDGESSVHVVSLDKPRRGPDSRYFTNSLSGASAKLWEIAELVTGPARNTLAHLGKPSDMLFIGRALGSRAADDPFCTDWSNISIFLNTWNSRVKIKADDGELLRVTLKRLRLTEQVINQRASQNSEETSELIYRGRDPQIQDHAITAILQGQHDALNDASSLLAIKTLTKDQLLEARKTPSNLAKELGVSVSRVKQLLNGKLDTATTACVGFNESPFAERGKPCPASFLTCLGCKNAISTPEHLPRLIALFDALVEIGSAIQQNIWESDYKEAFSRLKFLLTNNASEEEISNARLSISKVDIDRVQMLLLGSLDAS